MLKWLYQISFWIRLVNKSYWISKHIVPDYEMHLIRFVNAIMYRLLL